MRYSTKNFLSSSPDESGSIICKIETQRASEFIKMADEAQQSIDFCVQMELYL